MRLIDADAVRNPYSGTSLEWQGVLLLKLLDEAPTIDIVRCKECKWKTEDNACDLNCRIDYLDGTETDMWFYVNDDDFCSYGEVRDE